MKLQIDLFFVGFSEEIENTKKRHFETNWPLQSMSNKTFVKYNISIYLCQRNICKTLPIVSILEYTPGRKWKYWNWK